ncbi:hypothetical protein CL643_04290 [bacterium]|nr:hypothetical protein [bacterium]
MFVVLFLLQIGIQPIELKKEKDNSKPELISVDQMNQQYAIYYTEKDNKSLIKVFDQKTNKSIFSFRPKGTVIRALDIEVYQNNLWTSSWPQGFYKIDIKNKKIQKKIPGSSSIFRFMPIISGYWESPDKFVGLARYGDSNSVPSPHYIELNMNDFIAEDESVIKINNRPDNGTEVKGVQLYKIHGEKGFSCVNVYEYGWANLCFFDVVFSYRFENNEYVEKSQKQMPDSVKKYKQFENGKYWAISEEGTELWSGWTGFDTTPEKLTIEDIEERFNIDCENGKFIDFSFSGYLWTLASCEKSDWLIPLKVY